MMLWNTKCEKNSKFTKNRKIHLILHFCTFALKLGRSLVKNTQFPEARVCTFRKYAKCTKVEKSSKRKLRNSLTAVQFLLLRLFGKLSRRCTTQNFKVYIWWLKEKCKTQKQLSFVYEVKFFFTTMTRFIFVNQKLHSKIEEHTGHDFCRTFFELWWHFQLRKKMKVQHLHLSDVKYHQVQNSQFQIISKGPMCFRHFTSGF